MEFCSKCGGMLLPEKVRGKTRLKCQVCGKTFDLRGKTKSYKITAEGEKRSGEIPIIEEKKKRKERVEVIEAEPIEYYEELFE